MSDRRPHHEITWHNVKEQPRRRRTRRGPAIAGTITAWIIMTTIAALLLFLAVGTIRILATWALG